MYSDEVVERAAQHQYEARATYRPWRSLAPATRRAQMEIARLVLAYVTEWRTVSPAGLETGTMVMAKIGGVVMLVTKHEAGGWVNGPFVYTDKEVKAWRLV